ncbi:hypothetical protein L1987_20112 [Smallanthus sonchifolius]|uniref:Uncharacterized protein n=1 Tax=Smallanthus sonchifolius TaxID=185202 RepID=A0ACB9ISQ9_9ASTR|nr:hypothetical protein L1987_20112 [Smallanthus sonchifolius]
MAKADGIYGNNGVLHEKYELGRQLRHGTFAKVYNARNLHTGWNVAMKVVAKENVINVGMMEQLKREISVKKMVRHPAKFGDEDVPSLRTPARKLGFRREN